jgi:hypothetical protein
MVKEGTRGGERLSPGCDGKPFFRVLPHDRVNIDLNSIRTVDLLVEMSTPQSTPNITLKPHTLSHENQIHPRNYYPELERSYPVPDCWIIC